MLSCINESWYLPCICWQVKGQFDKVELIRSYKFCVAMENSITKDYITEKMWQVRQGVHLSGVGMTAAKSAVRLTCVGDPCNRVFCFTVADRLSRQVACQCTWDHTTSRSSFRIPTPSLITISSGHLKS